MTASQPRWDCHAHVFGNRLDHPVIAGSGYVPPERTLADFERDASPSGIRHVVLIQPSVYGLDNTLMLDALADTDGRHRGVVVIDAATPAAEIARMHGLGVRGVRFNLASGGGNGLTSFHEIAARIQEAGWHVQFFAEPSQLPTLIDLQQQTPIPFVIDHLGSVLLADTKAHSFLWKLMESGRTWVKASAFYRWNLPTEDWVRAFRPLVQRLAADFPDRVVWGSDWPHTWFFSHGRMGSPRYADTIGVLENILDADALGKVLSTNAAALYR